VDSSKYEAYPGGLFILVRQREPVVCTRAAGVPLDDLGLSLAFPICLNPAKNPLRTC
jgi:hypothetical protein